MAERIPTLDTLEAILGRLDVHHAELCRAAEDKRAAIVKGDLSGLDAVLAREKALVTDIETEERKRLMAIRVARRGMGLPEQSDGTLGDLLERAAEPQRSSLAAVRDRLKATLKTLRVKDRINAELLRASLEHVNAFMRTVREAAGASTTYSPAGRRLYGDKPLFDRQA